MNRPRGITIERSTPTSRAATAAAGALGVFLAAAPLFLGAAAIDRLTTLFIYIILGTMWNALAGYGGLVSVGQQAFFGIGAYAAIRLSHAGISVYPAVVLGALLAGLAALLLSSFALRLRGGEFAIGMWVLAELCHLLVNLDGLIQGETGTSLIALDQIAPAMRRVDTYWLAFAAMAALLLLLFALLRGRFGGSIQAIRDNEVAAASLGVKVPAAKRIIFVIAGLGCGMAGALWLASSITFQPKTYFGIEWTAYMIFMALVGGLGTFEGPILGAVLFFLIELVFGASGIWYMVGLGAAALIFALFLPRGIWGAIEDRFGLRLLPLGYTVRIKASAEATARDRPAPTAGGFSES